jgi:hypothetical protein
MDWIAFSDRKPQKSGDVLIFTELGCGIAYYVVGEVTPLQGDRFLYTHLSGMHTIPQNITHWMPLPDPPKE